MRKLYEDTPGPQSYHIECCVRATALGGSSSVIIPPSGLSFFYCPSFNSSSISCFPIVRCEKMSAEVATDPSPRSEKSVSAHPFSPLSASELQDAAAIIKASWPAHTDLHFKVVTLQEPPKVEALKYLEAEHSGKPLPSIARKAFVNYYIRNTVCAKMLEV